MKIRLDKLGIYIVLIALLVQILHTWYFGNNWIAQSTEEALMDGICIFFVGIGNTLVILGRYGRIKQ